MRFSLPAWMALGLVLATAACSSSSDDGAGGGGGGDGTGTDTGTGTGGGDPAADDVDVSLTFACVDEAIPDDPADDVSSGDSLAVTGVERCIFDRANQNLTIVLQGQGTLTVGIAGFTGAGTYVTDPLGGTVVSVIGVGDPDEGTLEADTAGDVEGDDSPAYEATLAVTTDLGAEGTETSGSLTVDATVANVGAAAIGVVRCDVEPSTFRFTVGACEAF